MTVDEIFSSESEHLYFRLVAARNALNAAGDSETEQVLNDILDQTLNHLERVGTQEEIAAAEQIVVRKSNKTVKDYLTSKRFSMIALGVGLAAAAISLLVLCIILFGSNSEFKDKIKPIITIVLIGGGITAASLFISSFMKKKMAEARGSLRGKTVIGCKLDASENKAQPAKSSGTKDARSGKAKVVRNYGGILKIIIPVAIIAVIAFLIYDNREKIVMSAKEIMYKTGLYDPAPEFSLERYDELRLKLLNGRKKVYYDKAQELYENESYLEASEMYKNCGTYQDAEAMQYVAECTEYYKNAKEALPNSMVGALTYLNKLTPSYKMLKEKYTEQFNEIKSQRKIIFEDSERLKSQYNAYLEYVGTYKDSDEKFVITGFAIRDYNSIYINEERLGWKKLSNATDRDGYTYKVVENNGEEEITWYIALDKVLKVSSSGEKELKK